MSVALVGVLANAANLYKGSPIYCDWPDEYASEIPIYHHGKAVPVLHTVPCATSNGARCVGVASHAPVKFDGNNLHSVVVCCEGEVALRPHNLPKRGMVQGQTFYIDRVARPHRLRATLILNDHVVARVHVEPCLSSSTTTAAV